MSAKADMAANCVVVEVDGPTHFYRGTREYTSRAKLKHAILAGLGLRVVNVPYFDYGAAEDKRFYLLRLLQRASAVGKSPYGTGSTNL